MRGAGTMRPPSFASRGARAGKALRAVDSSRAKPARAPPASPGYSPLVADANVLRSKVKPKRRFLKAQLIAGAAVLLVGLVAYETGWLGWGWADLMARAFPKDEALLGYLPADTTSLAIVDPHLLKIGALGPATGAVPSAIERVRGDMKKTLDVNLGSD